MTTHSLLRQLYFKSNEFNLPQNQSDDEGLKDESAEARDADEVKLNPPESKTVSFSLHGSCTELSSSEAQAVYHYIGIETD